MKRQQFQDIVSDPRYTEITDLADLHQCMGCMVRIKRKQRPSNTSKKYLPGGILTHFDDQEGFISFKSLINGRTYSINCQGATLYVLDNQDYNIEAWTNWADSLCARVPNGGQLVQVNKLH